MPSILDPIALGHAQINIAFNQYDPSSNPGESLINVWHISAPNNGPTLFYLETIYWDPILENITLIDITERIVSFYPYEHQRIEPYLSFAWILARNLDMLADPYAWKEEKMVVRHSKKFPTKENSHFKVITLSGKAP
jgi:hypothetical protein